MNGDHHGYPHDAPICKHDLEGPWPIASEEEGGILSTEFGSSAPLTSTESVLSVLEESSKKKGSGGSTISVLYTYKKCAPKVPKQLSRKLVIVGFADESLSFIRKLSLSPSEDLRHPSTSLPPFMKRCTFGVKRADSSHRDKLDRKNISNSDSFATLMTALRKANAAAIVDGRDVFGRFGILRPLHRDDDDDDTFMAVDYAASCYVGRIKEVKKFLAEGGAEESKPSAMEVNGGGDSNGSGGGDGGMWLPPGADSSNGDNADDTGGGDSGGDLWKPPGSDDASARDGGDSGGGGLWLPPGGDSNTNEPSTSDFSSAWSDPAAGGGAPAWNTASTTSASSTTTEGAGGDHAGQKRPRSESTDAAQKGDDDGQFHADSTAAAADAFYSRLTRSLSTRADSRLYHMRAFNGWVKATQIAELDPKTQRPKSGRARGKRGEPLRVLDLACGKGGDLGKWTLHNRGIENYVGIDVARGSLKDAAIRARKMRNKLKRCTFTCADLGADVPGRPRNSTSTSLQRLMTWSLSSERVGETADPEFKKIAGGGISVSEKFDVVSIQFAIHYMMSTKKRARRFFQTVSSLLDVGGNLIATTIDARVVLEHMMGMGIDLRFNSNEQDGFTEPQLKSDSGETEEEGATVRVGGGVCRLKFEHDTIRKIFQRKQPSLDTHTDNFHDDEQEQTELDDRLFGLEYTFTLVEGTDHSAGVGEAVDLPEWLTPIPALKALAEEAGFELEYTTNFHEFYDERRDPTAFPSAHSALYNMKVLDRRGSISQQEWEISRMYMAAKFRKVKESTVVLEDDDIDDDEEEEDLGTKPAASGEGNKKMIPVAMANAKREAGDMWNILSGDDKKERINTELKKLMG